jgi:hypothetical protein
MPVYLTIYNPGAARSVDLAIVLQLGTAAPIAYRGALDFPGAAAQPGGLLRLPLPANAIYFTTLLAPKLASIAALAREATWHAALFDAATGGRIGELSSARFVAEPKP